jgi:hypothetical protein
MFKPLLTVIIFSAPLAVNAQPAISPEKYGMWNNSLYNTAQYPENIKPGNSGASVTWNFSNLTKDSETKHEILPPSSTTYAATFPQANAVRKTSDGSMFFLNVQADKNEAVGYVFQSEGLVIPYSDPMLLLKRPLSYQDAYTDHFRSNYKYMGDSTTGGGTITVTADGYGTLMLPGKTYTNVLRVHSVQESADTAQTSGVITQVRVETYTWYDASHTFSLMELECTKVENPFFKDSSWNARYLVSESLGVDSKNQPAALQKIYLSGDQLIIESNFIPGETYNITISNSLGQVIVTEQRKFLEATPLRIDLKCRPPRGIYFVSVLASDRTLFSGSYLQH